MQEMDEFTTLETVRQAAIPLKGGTEDYGSLLDLIGDAPLVLLGEASHGTHEFHHRRVEITRLLIRERGFDAVLHIDSTRVVEPLERTAGWDRGRRRCWRPTLLQPGERLRCVEEQERWYASCFSRHRPSRKGGTGPGAAVAGVPVVLQGKEYELC